MIGNDSCWCLLNAPPPHHPTHVTMVRAHMNQLFRECAAQYSGKLTKAFSAIKREQEQKNRR
eukprot:1062690-Karenia_brevis.AAC.1